MKNTTKVSDRNVDNPGVCKHGSLRRSCETCDLAEQLDAALLKLDGETTRVKELEQRLGTESMKRIAAEDLLRRFVSFAVEMPADLGTCLAMGNKIVVDAKALLKERSQ